jgi:antitoxin MazE
VRIPTVLASRARIVDGAEVELSVDDGRLIVATVEREPTLDEMLDQVTPENRHGLLDWGPAVGKEGW